MKSLKLNRLESTGQGTFGQIAVDDVDFMTGELPWRDNRANISCIPTGIYSAAWTFSNRFQKHTYELFRVPGRYGIRIHPANFMGDRLFGYKSELDGCIAMGFTVDKMSGQKAVLKSKDAVKRFEELLNHEPFTLEITDK